MGYSPWGHKEPDTTWQLTHRQSLFCSGVCSGGGFFVCVFFFLFFFWFYHTCEVKYFSQALDYFSLCECELN